MAIVRALLGALLGWAQRAVLLALGQPSAEERAARAEAQLESREKGHEITTKGAHTRADAADRVVRSIQSDNPRAELRKRFPGASRD